MAFNKSHSDICFLVNCGPIPIHWAGWHTNSNELRANGWEVLASEKVVDHHYAKRIRVAVKSPDRKLVITGSVEIPCQDLHAAQAQLMGHYINSAPMHGMDKFPLVQRGFNQIQMEVYTAQDRFVQVNRPFMDDMDDLRPITASFDPYRMPTGVRDLVDPRALKIFEYVDTTNAIYIPPHNEDELLNMILKIQYPNQQEIKKRLVLPESKPIIKAQIFTLAA